MTGKERREQILVFLRAYITAHGYSPTFREIGQALGGVRLPEVADHILRLRLEGQITRLGKTPRTIRPVNIEGE